jgi:hypothetical protein
MESAVWSRRWSSVPLNSFPFDPPSQPVAALPLDAWGQETYAGSEDKPSILFQTRLGASLSQDPSRWGLGIFNFVSLIKN